MIFGMKNIICFKEQAKQMTIVGTVFTHQEIPKRAQHTQLETYFYWIQFYPGHAFNIYITKGVQSLYMELCKIGTSKQMVMLVQLHVLIYARLFRDSTQ